MARKRMQQPKPSPDRTVEGPRLFFESTRAATLYGVAVLVWLPVLLTFWLMTLPMPPGKDLDSTPVGPSVWLLVPVLLLLGALILAMPAAMAFLHDRYVLRLERTEAGLWRVTTWLHWGRRVREFSSAELAGAQAVAEAGRFDSIKFNVDAPYLRVRLPSGRRLIFDKQGRRRLGGRRWRGCSGRLRRTAGSPMRPVAAVDRAGIEGGIHPTDCASYNHFWNPTNIDRISAVGPRSTVESAIALS